jgi:NADPH2:quinone reductase
MQVRAPAVAPGRVVVDVHAAGVSLTDLMVVADRYQLSVPAPFTPGSEFAGIVAEVGAGVCGPRRGDPVCGVALTGAFAEQIDVPASSLAALPRAADLVEGAAFRVPHLVAYTALRTTGRLTAGEWVVITGAAGGVGSAAVRIAEALGARVLAVVSGRRKADYCTELGAAATVDSRTAELPRLVRTITGGGADLVVDLIGGRLGEVLLGALGWGGRFVAAGFASGAVPRIALNRLLPAGALVRALDLRRLARHEPGVLTRNEEAVLDLLGRPPPVPEGSRYPLERTGEALGALRDRTALGRLVVDVRPGPHRPVRPVRSS